MSISLEAWRPIAGFDGYGVSNLGSVMNARTGVRLRPEVMRKGYLRFRLYADGMSRKVLAHRLVAAAFIRKPNDSEQVNHIDGNKANNVADNLEWVLCKENIGHAIVNGLRERKPSTSFRPVHSPETIGAILRMKRDGMRQRDIARLVCASESFVSSVVLGRVTACR